MSSEDRPDKRPRMGDMRERVDEIANDTFDLIRRYTWSLHEFGPDEFYIVYCRKLEYDIEPYVLNMLVKATHETLQDEYGGSDYDDCVPPYDIFVGVLDKLVAKYKP